MNVETFVTVLPCRGDHLLDKLAANLFRFPDCVCDRNLDGSPYRVALLNTTVVSTAQTMYCFEYKVRPCNNPDSPCCQTDISKTELAVGECSLATCLNLKKTCVERAATEQLLN